MVSHLNFSECVQSLATNFGSIVAGKSENVMNVPNSMFDVAHMVLVGKVTQSDNLSVLAIINVTILRNGQSPKLF
jgi:hypothetical protein